MLKSHRKNEEKETKVLVQSETLLDATIPISSLAQVAELADAHASEACGEIRGGSNPLLGTYLD